MECEVAGSNPPPNPNPNPKSWFQLYHKSGLTNLVSLAGSGIRRVQRCLQCKGVMRNLDAIATVLQCKHCGADLANQQGFNRKASSLPWF